jgi:hypothetical protein
MEPRSRGGISESTRLGRKKTGRQEGQDDPTRTMKNLFGHVAVEKGFITMEVLSRVVLLQKTKERKYGTWRQIGQILREEGYLTEAQVREVVDAMGK